MLDSANFSQRGQAIGNGTFAYVATFTDDTSGVFAATSIAAPVPLPAADGLLLAGVGDVAGLRRRHI